MEKLIGASVWENELYEHLTGHEAAEQELLTEYREAAESSGSAAFAYLVALIIEDEIRHHRLFSQLADSLRTDAELGGGAPAVPRLDHWGAEPARVVALTEALLQRERDDERELHRLASTLRDLGDANLWPLLVRLMEMDTDKHIAILKFVRRQARRASPVPPVGEDAVG